MPSAPLQIVVIDTETTGLDPTRDRVIDIGAVRLGPDLGIVERFTTLVAPGRPLPLAITRLTGISDDDLGDAPPFTDAFEGLSAFAHDALIIGQNIAFDLDMLAAGARRNGLPALPNPSFDTLAASLLLFPELDRHNLRAMADHLGIVSRGHRALPDAEVTAALLAALSRRAAALPAAERRLIAAAGWEPLITLDSLVAAAPQQTRSGTAGRSARDGGDRIGAASPASLDCDPQAWRAAFAPGGTLPTTLRGFAERPGQVELAEEIAAVFGDGGLGLFEAGTGMGKSLAYLLPAAFHAAALGRRVVVSTRTKALQRQLAERELPLVAMCLPQGWRWALLMGRENYLCRRRLDEATNEAVRGLPDRDRLLALAYLNGRLRLGDVDLSALPFRAVRELPALRELARDLRSATATCLGRRCPATARCPWRLARARADTAHLVCVNHALLLTGGATLPAFEELIVDEAHLLPDEAISAHTERLDRWSLAELLTDLRGRRGQKALPGVAATAARTAPADVATALQGAVSAFKKAAGEIPPLIEDVGVSLTALAAHVLDAESGERAGALPADDGYSRSILLTAGLQEQPAFDDFATAGAALGAGLATLSQAAAVTAEALPEDHRERPRAVTLAAEAGAAATLLDELTGRLSPEVVGWVEIEGSSASGRGRRSGPAAAGPPPAPSWSLNRAPLSPAPLIRERLWERLRGAVLTSATLSVAGSFSYFREQAGLTADLDVRERLFASPFDFRRQATLVIEHDPETAFSAADLPGRQAERLRRLTEVTGGRLLALFTNKRHLEQVADQIGTHIEEDGVVVLAQGRHGSAAALAEEFRSQPATVLLGVDALWTGQDFPGDALVCLVIAKLPFPRQDALFRARRRAAEEEGRDWFRSFYLPEAVLKFRQGFGRLIRTETDYGVVAVLDHRLTQKNYQRDFLASLPEMEVLRAAPDELPAVVERQLRLLRAAAEDRRAPDD